jgi:hypothetical protein
MYEKSVKNAGYWCFGFELYEMCEIPIFRSNQSTTIYLGIERSYNDVSYATDITHSHVNESGGAVYLFGVIRPLQHFHKILSINQSSRGWLRQ